MQNDQKLSGGYLRLKCREDKWVRRDMALGVWACCVYVFMSPGSVPTDRMRPLSRHARYCTVRDCCCVLSLSWRAPLLCSHQHFFRSHIHHLGTPVTSVFCCINIICLHPCFFMLWFREASKYFPVEEKKIFALTYLETDVSLAQIEIDDVARTVRLRGWENVH